MTRTRRSAAHGRRGAFKRDPVLLQKNVKKLKSTAQKSTVKGRYSCFQCKKFEGPRTSVDDHCRNKHKLTGKKLQAAIRLMPDINTTGVKTAARHSEIQKGLQRSSTRQRTISEDEEKSSKKKRGSSSPERSKVVLKEMEEQDRGESSSVQQAAEKGEKTEQPPDSSEDTTKDVHLSDKKGSEGAGPPSVTEMIPGNDDLHHDDALDKMSTQAEDIIQSGKLDEVSTAAVTQQIPATVNDTEHIRKEAPLATVNETVSNDPGKVTAPVVKSLKSPETSEGIICQKCKRTFSKARQMNKHKCFAAMDDEPPQTPKRKPASSSSPGRAATSSKKGKPTKSVELTPKTDDKRKRAKKEQLPSVKKNDKKRIEVILPRKELAVEETKADVSDAAVDTTEKNTADQLDVTIERADTSGLPEENVFDNSAENKENSAQIDNSAENTESSESTENIQQNYPVVAIDTLVSEKAAPSVVAESPAGEMNDANAGVSDTELKTVIKTEATKSKRPRPSRYDKLIIKQEQISQSEKDKIEESIEPKKYTMGMVLLGASDRLQLAIQSGGTFCLCSFCNKIILTADQMKEHLYQHVKDYFPFKCKNCEFLARKRGRITTHMKKAHGGYLQCQSCSYNTYDKKKLDRHYKYWNRDFSNSCQFCHKKVPEGTKEEHMKTIHSKTPEELNNINLTADAFTCRHCGERQKSRHARRDHEKRHDPHYACPLCPYTTNGEAAFVNHGRKHRVVLVCSECLTKFHSSQALKDHLNVHIGEDNTPVQPNDLLHVLYERSITQSIFVASALDEASIPECDIIGLDMNMRVREEERRVSQQITGDSGRPVATVVTVEEMKLLHFGIAYDAFIRNIEYRHLSMQTLSFMFARYGKRECSYCGFLLHSLGSWKIHTGSHEGNTDLHCQDCDYKCRHKFLLDRHILVTHKKQDFGCDICERRFPYREYVYLHKRKDHYGGRMKCSYCLESLFETEDEKVMKRHIIEEHPEMTSKEIALIIGRKVHFTGRDGILFVKCKYCQKGFNRAAFLRQHVQLVHLKKKTFLCDQCGYKSNTSARLRTHMAVHTEVRDVTCDQCGAGFKNKVYLYKHIRRSHKRYATARGAAYCKRTRLKNMISLLQKERQEGSSYERQEIIQKEKAKLFGFDKNTVSVEGVRMEKTESTAENQSLTQINVYQCGDCGEYFETIVTLKKHFTIVHNESPNIPLDFDTGVRSTVDDNEQVNIALDALNNDNASNSVNQLFQCAKCNRMFPDMKTVEHHVKTVHATDTFLISDDGDIPTQDLDFAAEVINQLTRESHQSGQMEVMQNVLDQSAMDALSMEAQDAASALTSLPEAVLESSQVQAHSEAQQSVTYHIKTEEGNVSAAIGDGGPSSLINIPQELQSTNQGSDIPPNIKVVLSGRDDELEAAQLLQQMGIFQQFAAPSGSETVTTPSSEVPLPGTPSVTTDRNDQGELKSESVTIMVIEEPEKQ